MKVVMNQADIPAEVRRTLKDAMEGQQFVLYLQPIYNIKEKSYTAAEALSRWNHPGKGLLNPKAYIADMIACDMIRDLDYYMLDKVCAFLEQYQEKNYTKLDVSCNFTRETFSEKGFVQKLTGIMSRYHFNRKNLILELTEDTLAGDVKVIYDNIRQCHEMGLRVSLDDLGAGYSSLQDLCDYPVDIIKIDKQVVEKAITPRGYALIHSLTEFAHQCGIKVVCEGVETEEEKAAVEEWGCDYIQGFYYSRMVSSEDAINFFREHTNSLL